MVSVKLWIEQYICKFDKTFKLEPKTAFYDWLYIKALGNNKDLINEIRKFNIFSDIKFNPNKSLNCQARSLAIFRTLQERNINFNENVRS